MPWKPESIRALRSTRGLTQQDLAEALGVTVTAVSRWENGKHKPNRIACKGLDRVTNESVKLIGE